MRPTLLATVILMATGTHMTAHADGDDGDDVWPAGAHEKIGGLALEDPATKAVKLAGAPSKRTKPAYQGATGDYVAHWTFRDGLSLDVAQDGPGKPFFVRVIEVAAPSKWKTVEGIGISSTLDQLKTAYGKALHPPEPGNADSTWMLGDVYGGLSFTLKNDRVTAMYFGAMAE